MQTSLSKNTVTSKKTSLRKKEMATSVYDLSLVNTLAKLKQDLDDLHSNFDFVTDPILVDSYSYEILSLHMKYKFYLKLCKEHGLVTDSQ